MKRTPESGLLIAENFWQLTQQKPYESPVCDRTEARFLAFACALSENPSVLAPTAVIQIAEGVTALSLQKIKLKLRKAARGRLQTVEFGLDTRIVLNGFLAGTVFDLDPEFKPYRPLLNIFSIAYNQLGYSSNPHFKKARADLMASQDPIKLLAQYLHTRGIHADEAQMKINSDRFMSL